MRVVLPAVIEVAFDATVDRNHGTLVATLDVPGGTVYRPVVRLLALKAVQKRLPEEAKLVIDAVAVPRIRQTRQRIEEASRETAQATVPERWVALRLQHIREIDAHIRRHLGTRVIQAQIAQVVGQQAADQELHRKIVDLLGTGLEYPRLRGIHGPNNGLADRQCQREVIIRG